MSKTLKLKSGKAFPVDTIRKIAPITDAEREAMAGRYGKPLADFAGKLISIEFADKTKVTGDISLDEVRGQGIGIVNIGGDRPPPPGPSRRQPAVAGDPRPGPRPARQGHRSHRAGDQGPQNPGQWLRPHPSNRRARCSRMLRAPAFNTTSRSRPSIPTPASASSIAPANARSPSMTAHSATRWR